MYPCLERSSTVGTLSTQSDADNANIPFLVEGLPRFLAGCFTSDSDSDEIDGTLFDYSITSFGVGSAAALGLIDLVPTSWNKFYGSFISYTRLPVLRIIVPLINPLL